MSTARYLLDPAGFRSGGATPSAVYAYVDAKGAPVGAVARFEPKTPNGKKRFVQYRFDGERYLPGLGGARLPLYRLPEILASAADGTTVFIPEGEKCANCLVEAGFISATNAGGAGQWHAEDAEHFRGRDVVVPVDSDEPGRAHAHKVAVSLHGVARSVKVVEFEAKEEGDDVADWFERGGTAELLNKIVASTPTWEPRRAQTTEEWADPTPFGAQYEPDPFPLETGLPSAMRELASAVAECVRVDVAAPGVMLPTVVSGAAGNAFEIQVSHSHTEPNLSRYTMLVLLSGERKSALFRRMNDPVSTWVAKRIKPYKVRQEQYENEAELRRRKRDESIRKCAKGEAPSAENFSLVDLTPPRAPLGPLSDITSPELIRQMHANGGAVYVASADARHVVDAVLGQHRGDGQTDDSVYLRAHGGDAVDRARVGNAKSGSELIFIDRPALALALAIQPDKIEQLAARKETLSSGLLPRINFAAPRSLVGTRFETGNEQPIESSLILWYQNGVGDIYDARFRIIDSDPDGHFTPVRLILSDEAMEQRRAFFNELEAEIGPGCRLREAQAFVSKCAGETARLAGLFHLYALALSGQLEDAGTIKVSVETWKLAEAHQRWQLKETLRVLEVATETEAERTGRKLLEWARTRTTPGSTVTARDAIGDRRVKDAPAFEAAMVFLRERGWVRQVLAKGREQSSRWTFHPQTYGGVQ